MVLANRSSHQKCSMKKGVLEILQNSQENTCARVSFLIKLQALGEISKNTSGRLLLDKSKKFKTYGYTVNHILG